uniref:Jumping translocation breakpoint protein n=1 Tax=Arion vulgaris TaxID=1028688 RepID=A0A0B7B2S8_9EUPU
MMIEVFTKKRALAILAFIILITGASLILSSHWEYNKQLAKQEDIIKNKAKKTASCENFTTISRCERCSKKELRDLVPACSETGFKELIKCESGVEEFIWCDISPAVEEYGFWRFQLCTLSLGLFSYAMVYLRQRKLDKRLMEKIHKQIAAGV